MEAPSAQPAAPLSSAGARLGELEVREFAGLRRVEYRWPTLSHICNTSRESVAREKNYNEKNSFGYMPDCLKGSTRGTRRMYYPHGGRRAESGGAQVRALIPLLHRR
jgi:hypothetical protein